MPLLAIPLPHYTIDPHARKHCQNSTLSKKLLCHRIEEECSDESGEGDYEQKNPPPGIGCRYPEVAQKHDDGRRRYGKDGDRVVLFVEGLKWPWGCKGSEEGDNGHMEAKVCREGEKFGCSFCFHHDDGAEENCRCSDDHVLNRNLLPKKLCKCDIRKGA